MLDKKKKYGYIDMIIMPFKISPFYAIVFAAKSIFTALLPTFSIFITAEFLNVSVEVYNQTVPISAVYKSVGLLAGIMIYNSFINIVMRFLECKREIYYRNKLAPMMLERQAKLEYHYIENPQTADLINRVCSKFQTNIWEMYLQVLNVVDLVIYITGIMISLFTQVWWIAVCTFFAAIPILYIATKAGMNSYNADREMSKIDRRVTYLSSVMKERDAVEERNVYEYTDYLNSQYTEKYEFARKFRLKVVGNNFIKQKSGGIITTLFSVGVLLTLLTPVVIGKLDFSMFVALMGAVFGLSSRLSWGVNWIVEDLTKKREYLRDLTEFMMLEEHADAIAFPEKNMTFKKIDFKEVSFKYPGTDKLILDRITFTIEKGKHYSFVGENGAGKTTIIKLITGLYTNYEGEILVDGISLRTLTQAQVKGLSSVVYQDFVKYSISLYENIALGDLNRLENRESVDKVIKILGLSETVNKLKDGLDTPLGKVRPDGVDISSGEWQRVAMARSVLSKAPLKILDEPTAALDPVSESKVYNNFEQISKGMTTIFISHRLGSTKLADIIYVLVGGKIVESGSHSTLISKNGEYARMWNFQAEWYNLDK